MRGFTPEGSLENWSVGVMGELVLLHLVQDKFTR